ncbi:hypothetical protein ABK040_000176 [Willaertia magna]
MNSSNIMIGDKPLDPYIKELFGELLQTTKTSNSLPSTNDFQYYSNFPQFSQALKQSANTIQQTLTNFFNQNIVMQDTDMIYNSTVDLLDQYIENVDIALDEIKNQNNSNSSNQQNNNLINNSTMDLKSMIRPQLKWKDVDNSNSPFIPKLKFKPNSVISLEKSLKLKDEDDEMNFEISSLQPFPFRLGVGNGIGGEPTRESYPHPYLYELLNIEFMPKQYKISNENHVLKSLEDTTCQWISTVDDLNRLASILESQSEFAIDLEQHSYRTFQGFVCLMQISTRTEDYLVDTLELREHLHVLNTSFTHPKIVKVMHGADCDILWLQRDFGLYVVNLFDTGQACRILTFPSLSFAYLLKRYLGIDADKKYQLADWRVRPLPSEMVKYAREDTHYLLYLYDRLCNDILQDKKSGIEKMEDVLQRSRELCMRRFEKELFTETSYLSVLNRFTRNSNVNEKVFRVLYRWRDTVARKEDESIRYVLPDHMMFTIAQETPRDIPLLLSCCNPVPKLVRRDAKIIVDLIKKALENNNDLFSEESFINHSAKRTFELESPIANPHYKTPSRMSPVMNTDELYDVAGWIEKKNHYPSCTISKLTFSEEEDEDLDISMISTNNRTRQVTVTPTKSSSLFNFDQPMNNDPPHKEKVNKIISSFSSQYILPILKDEMEKETFKTPELPKKSVAKEMRVTPEEERVPLSLNEIYKLSQKNRKRNKQKKQLKQDSSDYNNDEEEESTNTTSIPQQQDNTISSQKPVDFMKKIGWLGAEEEVSEEEEDEEETETAPVPSASTVVPTKSVQSNNNNNTSRKSNNNHHNNNNSNYGYNNSYNNRKNNNNKPSGNNSRGFTSHKHRY